jgi:hypothetical protein
VAFTWPVFAAAQREPSLLARSMHSLPTLTGRPAFFAALPERSPFEPT